MKQIIVILIGSIFFISCNSEKRNMLVEGKIKGFQKGTVYLEKINDTIWVKVDSVILDGTNTFTLYDNVRSPQIYNLTIAESNKRIQFFGEKGKISILSDLKTFGYHSKIKGSKNQKFMDTFRETNTKFNNLKLDLMKEKFEAVRDKETDKLKEIEKKIFNIKRRRYLYTANFAVNHADFEIAPYLALSEIYDANPKILDTIVKSMSTKVRQSMYGKKLITYLEDIKKEE